MPDLLKNMFNRESLREIALAIQSVYAPFQVDEFLKSTIDETWDDLELKARGMYELDKAFVCGFKHKKTLSGNPFNYANCKWRRTRQTGF